MERDDVILYCPLISTYGRIAAMVAEESGASWSIVPTDPRAKEALARQPFGKSPAAIVAHTELYESVAICQLIDDTFNDGQLQASAPVDKARMNQWLSIANCYIFPTTEMGLVAPLLLLPAQGFEPRTDIAERHLPMISRQFDIVEERLRQALFLAGLKFSLADIFLYVMMDAVMHTAEGKALLEERAAIRRWFVRVGHRPSAKATAWPRGLATGGA